MHAVFVEHVGGERSAEEAPPVARSDTLKMLAQSSKSELSTERIPSFEIFAPVDLRTPAKSNRGKGQGTTPPPQTPTPSMTEHPTPTEADATQSPARSLLVSPTKPSPTSKSPAKAKASPAKTSPTKTSPTKHNIRKGFVSASSLTQSRRAQSVASMMPKSQGYWKCRCCMLPHSYLYSIGNPTPGPIPTTAKGSPLSDTRQGGRA